MLATARRGWPALLVLPPVALAVLLAAPEADMRWEDHPSHFCGSSRCGSPVTPSASMNSVT